MQGRRRRWEGFRYLIILPTCGISLNIFIIITIIINDNNNNNNLPFSCPLSFL
ncbi:hypothetical protein L211DRAFT_835160 [Terfezia boudieri ATCC MYA-4762]|uniref:Uncharacterized protein n=1 Tax=Terfezia boudieri ATCC MYA-4762 TaxID=1051890 RepID=A0A3N4LVA9_9PEZI|nr:hypothetical protein L211DRAFT_835160 [Terfezia boudieri ATCC MYA-4762]